MLRAAGSIAQDMDRSSPSCDFQHSSSIMNIVVIQQRVVSRDCGFYSILLVLSGGIKKCNAYQSQPTGDCLLESRAML